MRSARLISATYVGLLVTCCGCYHYGYHGPGGGYPPPGSYPPPTLTPVPSAPYVPYNSQGVSPTPITPNGTSTPNWQSVPGGALPGNPNAAPPYDSPGNKPVPNPTTDEQNFGGGAPAGASLPPSRSPSNVSGSGIELQPIEFGASTQPSSMAARQDPFGVPAKPVSAGTSRPNPFDHDANGFTWMRGVLSYDQHDQRWMIMYSDNPDAGDRYGGSLTLSDHPLLNRLKPDDVAYVEGSVSANSIDKDGKPIYQIKKLVPLRPRA